MEAALAAAGLSILMLIVTSIVSVRVGDGTNPDTRVHASGAAPTYLAASMQVLPKTSTASVLFFWRYDAFALKKLALMNTVFSLFSAPHRAGNVSTGKPHAWAIRCL